ncbi:MAG TPA: hypothetical protein VGM64_18675 [Lacunisphaera sp.]|jgi:hypothetical protein
MDHRVGLLKEFYAGLPQDRVKLEIREHGFAFLEKLLSGGVTLDYGELTLTDLLHKYKLTNIPPYRMDELLEAHVAKRCNVCLYFEPTANSLFCFNLDNNHKTNNTVIIPEMDYAVKALRDLLCVLGCEPLILASGRGYHVWGRLERAVDNDRLYEFLSRAAVRILAQLHSSGFEHQKIKFNVYPDKRIRGVVSLRLFGSEHAKNKVFSKVCTPEGLLDEAASWAYFENYLASRTISLETFDAACVELGRSF